MTRLLGTRSWLIRPRIRHEVILLMLLLVLFGVAAAVKPDFLRWSRQMYASRQLWDTAMVAIAMTMIIITGGIDLSVGSLMGLCAVTFGILHGITHSVTLASLGCLATGLVGGMTNGWLISTTGVHPLLVTLATMAGFRGIAEGISQGASYSRFGESFGQLARGSVVGIPFAAWIFAMMIVAYSLWLARTPSGRFLYAIGNNELAARYSGVPVRRIKSGLYAHSGLLTAMATLIYLARFDTAKADAGTGLELEVITAVVVGGTSIYGGRGTLIGTTLGLLLIHEAKLFVGQYWQRDELKSIMIGTLLVISVLAYRLAVRKNRDSL